MLYFQGVVSSVAFLVGVCVSAATFAHGCTVVDVRNIEGELRSPNFPQQFDPDNCTIWIFHKKDRDVVTLSFKYLDLPRDPLTGACFNNYIQIGPTTHDRVVCGEQAEPYTSPADVRLFTMKFFAGSIPKGHGFIVSYSIGPLRSDSCAPSQYHCRSGKCIPFNWRCNSQRECEDGSDESYCYDEHPATTRRPSSTTHRPTTPPLYPVLELPSDTGCGRVFHNRSGRFGLSVHPGTRNVGICSFHIEVPGNVDKIVLRFLQFDLKFDAYIAVYRGTTPSNSGFLGTFTQDSDLGPLTSFSSSMLVVCQMLREYPATASGDLFFSAYYTAYGGYPQTQVHLPTPTPRTEVPSSECYHQLFDWMGNFSMPAPPYHRSDIRDCIWHIQKFYSGSYIHLIFNELHLRDGASVQVYDGHNDRAPSLGIFSSGNHFPLPLSLRSSGGSMLVKFYAPVLQPSIRSQNLVFEATYHFEDRCELADEISCGPEDNRCYSRSKRCDGVWDCPHSGWDEAGCHGCPKNSYSCNDFAHGSANKCYFKHDRCSGSSVCANYADEENCDERQCSESRNLFLCANKRCIISDFLCDETDDCGDRSDEVDCRLGSSRKVIVAAVVGSLLCALLLVLSLGCACKVYTMRNNNDTHAHHHHHRRGARYDTPLSRLQAEMFRRRAPPPPYHEAMLTSRPYDEAVREYFAQMEPAQQAQPPEQESRSAEEGNSVEEGAESADRSVQNLISLMDFSEEGSMHRQPLSENSGHPEDGTSSDSDSEAGGEGQGDDSAVPAEDGSGQIEMMVNFSRGRPASGCERADAGESVLLENISEDSASAVLSADSQDTLSLVDETQKDSSGVDQDSHSPDSRANDSDKDTDSDADSVCILCLDDDPAAPDDGTDTRCLLQEM